MRILKLVECLGLILDQDMLLKERICVSFLEACDFEICESVAELLLGGAAAVIIFLHHIY